MRKIDYSIRSFKIYKLTGDRTALTSDFIYAFNLLKTLTMHEHEDRIYFCDVMGYIYLEYRQNNKLLRMASDSIIHVFAKKFNYEHEEIKIIFKYTILEVINKNVEKFGVVHGEYLAVKIPDSHVF